MRMYSRAMDSGVILHKGIAGCPIAVLSSPRCSKARKRHTVFSICKYSVGEKGAQKAGQASMRVRRRVMDLRADLDNGDEGNTCCIIKSPLFKGARKGALSCVPA